MDNLRERLYKEKVEELKSIINSLNYKIKVIQHENDLLYCKNACLEYKLKVEKDNNVNINKRVA